MEGRSRGRGQLLAMGLANTRNAGWKRWRIFERGSRATTVYGSGRNGLRSGRFATQKVLRIVRKLFGRKVLGSRCSRRVSRNGFNLENERAEVEGSQSWEPIGRRSPRNRDRSEGSTNGLRKV